MKELYITYTATQLASEDLFIAWIMNGAHTHEWEEWLRQHVQVNTTVAQARSIVLDMMHLTQPTISDAEQQGLWNKIAADISAPVIRTTIIKSKAFRWVTAAAAAAIAILIWNGTRTSVITVATLAGEQEEIQLPESSHVQLNAGSSLVYDARHFSSDRELTLTGEAFFKVHPGSRFTVHTSRGSITVLGTSFNVIAWPDRFEVTCFTGKVRVENESQEQLIITPGEQCKNDEATQKLTSSQFDLSSATPEWIRGKFIFNNQPLKIVAEELERQYNVKVKLAPGLEEVPYIGLFESGNLDTALKLITWPLSLKSTIKGDTISIVR